MKGETIMGPVSVITEQEMPWDPNSAFTVKPLETEKEDEDENK
jgi:hypothetical protein